MPDNKKHHFVPRFYLKRFSRNGKSISIFNAPSGRVIKLGNLSNQCYKDYFYGKDQIVEKRLSSIEGRASEILDRMFTQPYSASDHINLILYIAIQHGRTNYAISTMNEMMDRFMKYVGKHEFERIGANPEDFEFTFPATSQNAVINAMLGHYALLDLRLKIIRAEPNSFVTSDTPVVFYNQFFENDSFCSNSGLYSKGLQIFFPIDSSTTLLFYDPCVYAVGGRKSDIVLEISQSDIEQINGLQIASADKNVYFEDSEMAISDLASKFTRYRRRQKSNLTIHPGISRSENEYSEILATSIEDLRIGLNLSFIRTLKRARMWKTNLDKQNSRPVMIARNEPFAKAHEEFVERARNGELKTEDSQGWCHGEESVFSFIRHFKAF